MKSPAHKALIVTLAEMLSKKQIDSNIITAALRRISAEFSFESALVYSVDQHNIFHLKERCLPPHATVREQFVVEDISPEYRKQVAAESVSQISGIGELSPSERTLLRTFDAGSLVLASVVDERMRIFGLIVFSHSQARELSAGDFSVLSVLLPLLIRYVSIRMYQNKLVFAQTSLESILDNAGVDIYVNDFYTHEILYANKSMAAPYGGREKFIGNKCWSVLFPHQKGVCEFCPQTKLIDTDGNPSKLYVWDYQRSFDGAWFRVFSSAFRWVDGRLAHVVSSADITENKRNEETIYYMANFDSLTKLPNRRKLVSDCTQRINSATKNDSCYLLFFDIDGFKAINDTLGHDAGDEFLVQLGEFFTSIPMLKDCTYRNGGDEFVALVGHGATEAKIRTLAGLIHERFKKAWMLKNGDVFCNTSIGVAYYPKDASTPDELLQKADQAMYRVKKQGGGDIGFY